MRRAKIVCTLGPVSTTQEMVENLLESGMDVARLNFSHGTHEAHRQVIDHLRAASLKVRKAVGILGDLQGPKIRTGRLEKGEIQLVEGREFSITTDESVVSVADRFPHLGELGFGLVCAGLSFLFALGQLGCLLPLL